MKTLIPLIFAGVFMIVFKNRLDKKNNQEILDKSADTSRKLAKAVWLN
jgi:hypothetical protein